MERRSPHRHLQAQNLLDDVTRVAAALVAPRDELEEPMRGALLRITRLRRQGERYFADGLRELPDNRRLAILVVCAVEWETCSRG